MQLGENLCQNKSLQTEIFWKQRNKNDAEKSKKDCHIVYHTCHFLLQSQSSSFLFMARSML